MDNRRDAAIQGFRIAENIQRSKAGELNKRARQVETYLRKFLDGRSSMIKHQFGEETLQILNKQVLKLKTACDKWEENQ